MDKAKIGAGPYLYPMPAVLAGAIVDGKPNYLAVGFAGAMNIKPPVVYISVNSKHHTTKGIRDHGCYSINIPSASMIAAVDYCGIHSGREVDKSELFTNFFGELEKAPMIAECPVNLECRVIQEIPFGDADIAFIAEVVETYCSVSCLTGKKPDMAKVNAPVFSVFDRSYYATGEKIGQGWRIGKEFDPHSA